MSREVLTPFSISGGMINVTFDPDVQTRQHVDTLVATQPGERVMLPDYGVPTVAYVFSPGDKAIAAALANDATAALQKWEPNVNVQSVRAIDDPTSYGTAKIEVDFLQNNVSMFNQINTATVAVGGSVT